MGVEDLSLDEIIKKRKAANKKSTTKTTGMYSDKKSRGQTFQNKRLFTSGKQQGKVTDARLLIRSKTTITDARQKIKQKTVVDARHKIQEKHAKIRKSSASKQSSGNASIPKITISNEFAKKKPLKIPQITFRVTPDRNQRSGLQMQRKRRNSDHEVQESFGSGIKIAVKNEHATQSHSARPKGRYSSPQKKTFEKLKITTVNRDAIKRVDDAATISVFRDTGRGRKPSPEQLLTRNVPIRKRHLPESEDSFDEAQNYAKQRREQRFEEELTEEIYRAKQNTKTDNSTLRPMISRQRAPPKKMQTSDEEDMEVGQSPIEGTKLKVYNLHPVVTEDDILELFSVLGAVRRARLVKPGEAEVVYIKRENAFAAYKKYNNRDLDGQPMQIKFLSDEEPKQSVTYSWMKDVKSSHKKSDIGEVTELHSGVLQQALFKGGSTGTSTRPVVFTVKI